MTSEHEQQLALERRASRPAAAAAILSILLIVGSQVVLQLVVYESRPDSTAQFLIAFDQEPPGALISGVLQSLSYLALGIVLWFLFGATRYRRSEVPGWAIYTVYIGPILLAVGGVLGILDRIDLAHQFADSGVTSGRAGVERAKDLLNDRGILSGTLTSAGGLALALSLVLISLNAMRAGLLSRFMGYMGIVVGALLVLPLFPGPPIVQIFWLGSLAAVFLNHWPNGRGPAWESGRAEPWPSAAQLRQGSADQRDGVPTLSAEPSNGEDPGTTKHPVSRKRKRKKRS